MKIVLAHPELREDALAPAFREALAGAGATRLQVNLDDEAVAAARLRVEGPLQVRSVISTWVEGDDAQVRAVLRSLGDAPGWRVDERRPIEPPQYDDGERADALSNVAFLRRPETLTHDAWLAEWIGRHTQVAIDTQATFGYVQNVVTEAIGSPAAPVAGIVEELFPMAALTDWHAFYGSEGDDDELGRRMGTMAASCERFGAMTDLTVVPTSRYLFDLA